VAQKQHLEKCLFLNNTRLGQSKNKKVDQQNTAVTSGDLFTKGTMRRIIELIRKAEQERRNVFPEETHFNNAFLIGYRAPARRFSFL